MTHDQSTRSHLVIASAIILAGVLISASLFVAMQGASKTTTITATTSEISLLPTETVTTTSLSTTTTTLTATTTSTLTLTTSSSQTSTTTGTTTVCSITGQPGPMELRVLSNSTLSPIIGAQVAAVNEPAGCGGSPGTFKETTTFLTGSTEWYSLDGTNDLAYSFTVSYSGQNYSFTADLHPLSATCATLYIPSGVVDVTITEYGDSCS